MSLIKIPLVYAVLLAAVILVAESLARPTLALRCTVGSIARDFHWDAANGYIGFRVARNAP